jgi:hypothetical protein
MAFRRQTMAIKRKHAIFQFQLCDMRGANESGLWTHTATTENVTLCKPMKKLTAFLELEGLGLIRVRLSPS